MEPEEQQLAEALRTARDQLADPAATTPKRRWTSSRIDQTEVAFKVFANLLATDGIRAALYSLLRRTDYRFIAIFRFRDGKAASVVYVDRDQLNDVAAGEVADSATFCGFVRDAKGAFVTADAMKDLRVTEHVARDVVRAYCGLPLIAPDGEFIGTLCHYDLEPRDPEQLDPVLLVRAAAALVASEKIPAFGA